MEENVSFLSTLENALNSKAEEYAKTILPKLKDNFRLFLTSFQGIYQVLERKALIQKDPYKDEKKISEVQCPETGVVAESEKIEMVSIRMSDFDSQLDFLNNYYQFSIDFLTIERIKKLISLTNFIHWTELSESSTNFNTRILTELISKIKQGNDSLSMQLLQDSSKHMGVCSKEIKESLTKVSELLKEKYKLTLRQNLFSKMHLKGDAVISKIDAAVQAVRKKIVAEFGDIPFYPDLVKEIFNEDFSAQAKQLKETLLKRYEVKEGKSAKKELVSYKGILLEAIRLLSGAALHLEQILNKMQENILILEQKKLTVGDKFGIWLNKVFGKKKDPTVYEIEFLDPGTGTSRTLRLDMQTFSEKVRKKVHLLSTLSNKMSIAYGKLEKADEEKIFEFLNKNINEVNEFLRLFPGIDVFFKTEVIREQRSRIRGIKLEITAVKNCVIKSNQKKHEYVSRKEEVDQMKRLGIDVN